jgi:hypothetical protein
LLCKAFGHKPPIYNELVGGEYAKVRGDYEDNVGRHHAEVVGECVRCEEEFTICKIHIPKWRDSK